MIRKTWSLSVALVAIAAVSMAAAAGVQASQVHVTKNVNTVVTGTVTAPDQLFQLITDFGVMQCNQTLFEGTIPKAAQGTQVTTSDLTLTPTFTGCTAFGQNATIDVNGCKFTVTGSSTQGATTAGTAYLDITGCTSGKSIEITTPICTVTIPEQHNLSHIILTNSGTPPLHDITADFTIAGLKYEAHGALCPNGGGGTVAKTNGACVNSATFRAFEDLPPVHAVHNGHTYNKLLHNNVQVGILAT